MFGGADFTSGGAIARHPVVLIVEDEPLLQCATAEFLRLSGFTVLEAGTAAEAVALLSAGELIDLVFSDVCMSGPTDGLLLAQWLRQRYPDVPVMLTTAVGGAARDSAIEIVGNDGFLPKPYSPNDLVQRIRSRVR